MEYEIKIVEESIINKIIHQPEGRRLEFKETLPKGEELAKTSWNIINLIPQCKL